jgi:lipid-binding SYLF domain-containing protein
MCIGKVVHEQKGRIDMKKGILTLLAVVLAFAISGWAADNDESSKAIKRMDDAAADLSRLTNAPDSGIPQTVLAKAKCVAIIPSLVKAGFVFGGEHGRGVATCRQENNHRWTAPAFFTLTGGSWGAQIGGEAVDLVMLFMNDEGAEKLMASNWKIGGDVGIAAGPWGRQGSASTDWKMNTGILTYSKAKGAFIGATLNGANVHVDEKAMRAFYGHSNPGFRDVLTGKVPPPPQARQFLSSVRQNFHEANANK